MPFNSGKCSVMHVGAGNPCVDYNLQGSQVSTVQQQLDLGALMNSEFKFGAQCVTAEKKAQRILKVYQKGIHSLKSQYSAYSS